MHKTLYVLLFFYIFTSISFAASKTPLLDEFMKLKTFSASVEQVNNYVGVDELTSKGQVYIVRGESALWDFKKPNEYYLLKPDRVEMYSEPLNQLIVNKVNINDQNNPTSILLSFFLSNVDLSKKFDIVESGNTTTLKSKSIPELKSIVITYDKKVIKKVVAEDSEGNITTIKFSNQKQNGSIDKKVFLKEVPKGTQIVEQ